MLVRKTNPIGIDEIVDVIQTTMDDDNSFNVSWDNLHRAYKNPKTLKSSGFIPEVYTANGEYVECLMNDNVILTTFFTNEGSRDFNGTEFESELSLIVQCSNLEAIYDNIVHRPDEELIHAFVNLIKDVSEVKITDIETTIDDVYSGFDTAQLKFEDMGRFFVFKINMTATYDLSCCINC